MNSKNAVSGATEQSGMSMEQYLHTDAISSSDIVRMLRSPMHYLYGDSKASSAAQEFGTAVHCMLLEPDEFEKRYVVFSGDKRTKEYKEFKKHNLNKSVISPSDLSSLTSITKSVRNHPIAGPLLEVGKPETTILWESNQGACKARLDWITPDFTTTESKDIIVDLKTTRDPSPGSFMRQSYSLGYHIKAAWYQDALFLSRGTRAKFVIVAIENQPPYDVVCYDIPNAIIDAARLRCYAALERIRECRSTGSWPGLASEMQTLELPAYAAEINEVTEEEYKTCQADW